VTGPPPDLPKLPVHRPTIIHDQATPPADRALVEWPADGQFIVLVDADPNQTFQWAWFLDFGIAAVPPSYVHLPLPGGLTRVDFAPGAPTADGSCHRLDFVVAPEFQGTPPDSFHQEGEGIGSDAGPGGDIITWWYTGGLRNPASCGLAVSLPEGGFPLPEAASDGPPPVPGAE
jgi:hypothetical protein